MEDSEHVWPTMWVKFRNYGPQEDNEEYSAERFHDEKGVRTASGWRQFFAPDGGVDERGDRATGSSESGGSRSGAGVVCEPCGAPGALNEFVAGKTRCGACWAPVRRI